MWRLWNKLFGWEYALIKWGYYFEIRRVRKVNGTEFATLYGNTIVRSEHHDKWIPLTYKDET